MLWGLWLRLRGLLRLWLRLLVCLLWLWWLVCLGRVVWLSLRLWVWLRGCLLWLWLLLWDGLLLLVLCLGVLRGGMVGQV